MERGPSVVVEQDQERITQGLPKVMSISHKKKGKVCFTTINVVLEPLSCFGVYLQRYASTGYQCSVES